MPGFFSWISGLFSPRRPAVPFQDSRLLNPSTDDTEGTPERVEQLEEHLFCWLLDASPSELQTDLAHTNQVIEELQRRLETKRLDELPRQPLTLPMLMRALSDDATGRQQLTRIILDDPALTDQLLQIANSPYFRPGDQTIESVDQAVFLLGIDGIRNVISAAVMRPMMAARNSREALFAQRVWRWGLTCARSAELVAGLHGKDTSTHFMVGLLPALSYITLHRELQRISRSLGFNLSDMPGVAREALVRYQWTVSQLLANEWNLPPKYHAYLLSAERPAPGQKHAPLNDGMIIGTREVLRHAHQRNMAEEDLRKIIRLNSEQFSRVRKTILEMLKNGARDRT